MNIVYFFLTSRDEEWKNCKVLAKKDPLAQIVQIEINFKRMSWKVIEKFNIYNETRWFNFEGKKSMLNRFRYDKLMWFCCQPQYFYLPANSLFHFRPDCWIYYHIFYVYRACLYFKSFEIIFHFHNPIIHCDCVYK
jgi:hypothetical protein